MLKISINESKTQYRMVLEGKLVAPWTATFTNAGERALQDLAGRRFVIDVKNVTAIGEDGKAALQELMLEGASFICCGMFTRQVLKEIARHAMQKERKG